MNSRLEAVRNGDLWALCSTIWTTARLLPPSTHGSCYTVKVFLYRIRTMPREAHVDVRWLEGRHSLEDGVVISAGVYPLKKKDNINTWESWNKSSIKRLKLLLIFYKVIIFHILFLLTFILTFNWKDRFSNSVQGTVLEHAFTHFGIHVSPVQYLFYFCHFYIWIIPVTQIRESRLS